MATAVLSIVGGIVAGPIGAAIGAAVGQQIDQAVIGPGKRREGPRLKDLAVQTSSYGTQIPQIFGAMRVAGTVIWASDLIERRTKSGRSKRNPGTVNFSYSVNIAIALSSRPVARIGRIWADGNLLRGAAGDLKVETGFRFYSGYGDQVLDPLLAAAETAGQCPGYRGLAYAVFEDLQLADFGNRIPSLTFELFERDTAVPILAIADAASGGVVKGTSTETVNGYALSGESARSGLSPLLSAAPLLLRPDAEGLQLCNWFDNYPVTMIDDPLIQSGREKIDRPQYSRSSLAEQVQAIAIRHYEPARDYQTGIQQAERALIAPSRAQLDLPASLSADAARRFADLILFQQQKGGTEYAGYSNQYAAQLRVGAYLKQATKILRITEIEYLRGGAKIIARDWLRQDPSSLWDADPGRNLGATDLLVGETQLQLLDLPALTLQEPNAPIVAIAASGSAAGWRRAALSLVDDNRLVELGGTAQPAIMGRSLNALPAHNPWLIDYQNQLVVELPHSAMTLDTGTGDPLSVDAPTIWLGDEIIRYGHAVHMGNNIYHIKKLLRGCAGTEGAVAGHIIDETMVLLDKEELRILDEVPLSIGSNVTIEALGVGDIQPATASILVSGNALKPRSPVHAYARKLLSGDIEISWIRRTRIDPGWQDGVDIPLYEDTQRFVVIVNSNGIVLGEWPSDQISLIIATAEFSGLAPGTICTAEIRQQGRFALSEPAIITFTL